MVLDAIARRHGFSPWRSKFKGEVCEGMIAGQKLWLIKPQTFMNASGDSVQPMAAFLKISSLDITVFHDELDLAPGKIRVKRGGGAAGHNGLRDIDRRLATQDYWRVRLGIGHPGMKEKVHGHVLGNFAKVDTWLGPMLDAVADAAPLLVGEKPEEFMTRVALLTRQEGGA